MSSFSDREGPWQPLRSGMPIPSTGVGAAPLSSICFSSAWSPAVYQALSILLRPEAWAGDLAAVRAVILDAHELVEGIADGCVSAPYCSPVFVSTASGFMAHTNTPGASWRPDMCDGCAAGQSPLIIGERHLFGGLADQALVFEANSSGLPSGIHVCSFIAVQNDTTLTNVWNFQWEDCLGNINQELSGGTEMGKLNFPMKRWGLSSLAPYTFSITWSGPILCTEA